MKKSYAMGVALVLVAAGVFGGMLFGPEIKAALTPSATGSATGPAGAQLGSQHNPIPVDIRPVSLGRVRQQIEAVGSLVSDESVILRPEIAGRVVEILFDEGTPVKRGAPLIKLDATIARAQLAQAKASVALSQANFNRAKELFGRGAGTQRAHEEALAKLATDEAALALAQAVLDKSTIVAPFDGVMGLRQISVGDYVNPGQALVNIESLDQLKVDFRIPEVHAHLIAVNQTIQVRVDALPGKSFEGKVYAMDPAFDPGGRAAILRARLPNPNKQLNPGMFARVSLIVEDRANAVLVPETALVPVGNDIFAFRVIDGKAVMTKLRIGLRRAGEVEVLEGLSASDQIIAEGGQKIRDGQYVRASEIRGS
ncbi:efflux RND transporter periplasmic adaptor subunit [uncultured Ferrovibrio sp.]|jgi:membrane fusion protein (multidrug efflux system)|uniref:efflux RND transporter periplasmic adaptor subunit n=1 Tax=uncultured Ferrovibrio sp. TaxID=1576913 RepID=UPI00260229EF|nr:efflux RND transporter periplasmic adaptor subunit [uncultured Ferrovibrio sp.]